MLKRALSSRKQVLLAMGWYVHEVNVGVARYAHEAGWVLDDSASHCGVIPSSWRGDGIITISSSVSTPLAAFVARARVPVVDVSSASNHPRFGRVQPDNFAIGRVAAEEMLGRGFRHFSFFALDPAAPVVRERMKGFRDTVEEAGHRFYLLNFAAHMRKKGKWDNMIPWLGKELKMLPKPLAAMAQYDAEANYIVRASLEAGLHVPEEISVIGVDNDPVYSQLGLIPLTSVVSNRELVGYRGAEMLAHLMNGGAPAREPIRVPPGGVIVRRSTDIFASEDDAMSKALAFISAHCSKSIGVSDVVHASGVCRRTLFAKFANQLGRSIHRELLRQRLAKAKLMLSTNNEKLETIADECGFSSVSALWAVFRTHEGISPSEFRNV